ncbi:MAG: hypothetical protein HY939_04115 [Gammaproteobacteria bacterium]|nr:hypothetical protein [Gammaproteobacteria bacterium]
MKKMLVLMCVFLCLTACGFQLRGRATNKTNLMHALYIETPDPYGPLSKTLRAMLTAAGVVLVDSAEQAPYKLEMRKSETSFYSVGYGFSNQVSVNTVRYAIPYRLSSRGGEDLIPWRTVDAVRNFTINTNQALMGNVIPPYLLDDMRRDVANQIMMQLSAWKMHETQIRPTC